MNRNRRKRVALIFVMILFTGCGKTNSSVENIQTQSVVTKEAITENVPIITIVNEIEPLHMQYSEEWNELTTANIVRKTAKKQAIAEYISCESGEKWAFYAKGQTADFIYYDKEKQMIENETVDEHSGWIRTIPEGCEFLSVKMQDFAMEQAVLVKESDSRKIAVESISKAIATLEKEGLVIIFPGIYSEHVRAYGKEISFYGLDCESCILESTSSDYYSPPLEISAGLVKNMTIRAVDHNSAPSTLWAYGVHADDNSMADKELVFENCKISSDFNSAVGMGLRAGCSVEFIDCTLIGKENGLFCHDTPYQKYAGLQKLSMINCTLEGMEGKEAIRLDSQGMPDSVVELLFVNNVFQNANNPEKEGLLHVRNNNGKGSLENFMELKNFWLSKESQKNSIDAFND